MLVAMSFIVMWFGMPIIPIAPFLKFEPSDVPLLLAAVLYGPFAGFLAILAKNMLYFMIHGGSIFGIFMSFFASLTFVLVTVFLHRKMNLILAAVFGSIALALVMIPLNLIIVPLQFGTPFENVWKMLLPVYLPFNLIKGALNTTIFSIVYSFIKNRQFGPLKGEISKI